MNIRKYQSKPDGSIEYMAREWFITELVDKYYFEAVGNNGENEKDAQDMAWDYEMYLRNLTDEQLAQKYDADIGDPRME